MRSPPAIKLLVEHDVSALPVVDDGGKVVGVISEADLMRREEIGTERHRSWWLEAMTPGATLVGEFAKAHGRKVREIMSDTVVSATEETPLGGKSRGHREPIQILIQALATVGRLRPAATGLSDRSIRGELLDRLSEQTWTDFGSRNVIVRDGRCAPVGNSSVRRKSTRALLVLAEQVAGRQERVGRGPFPAY